MRLIDMEQRRAERFWDDAAQENALFYVGNRLEYRQPDLTRFWAGGAEAVDTILHAVGSDLRQARLRGGYLQEMITRGRS